MRTITGAIILVAAEQSYAHAHLIGFPHSESTRHVLLPVSAVLAVGGLLFLIWGLISDTPQDSASKHDQNQ
ncbi:hypothetical protein OAF98_02165 [Planctomicrobium sp.]|jgi:hypothetical protein|nr:hypothetical protein [Planctomicrobium sp.]MDA7504031.1 hypothetical protein [bacterium]MDB4733198.1 hypothetical protein [Planctomicrobium sp.]MDB4743266.1 hypothetical protein [Planctomicrobium sp.]